MVGKNDKEALSMSMSCDNRSHVPEKIHAISGLVTEHAQIYDDLTGQETLVFYDMLLARSF